MLKSIRIYLHKLIHSKYMLLGIGIASFLESTIVPIPLETILLPLMQAKRKQLWLIALVTTAGCVCGAVLGYFVGFYLFDTMYEWLVEYVASKEQIDHFQQQLHDNGFWFVFSTGVTPIPLQIAMLAAGITQYSFFMYLLAITSSRCIRYFGLAGLVYFLGDQAESFIKKYKTQTIIAMCLLIVCVISYKLI